MSVIIWVAGVLAALSALGVVFSPQPLYSALSLVLTIGALAVVFLVLNAQFLFVVQLIVYAGAVMVLFVFIIALLSPGAEERVRVDSRFVIGGGRRRGHHRGHDRRGAQRDHLQLERGVPCPADRPGVGPVPHVLVRPERPRLRQHRGQRADGRRPALHHLPAAIRDHLAAAAGGGGGRGVPDAAQPLRCSRRCMREAALTRKPTVLEEERIEVEVG